MKFQICKLILWPVNNNFIPRTIEFEQGKVNVITGDSRTGKTAIIPIMDYCLGSDDCTIPIEIIRDNVSWYGLIIVTSNKEILLARKAPVGNKSSSEYFKIIGHNIKIPNKIIRSNETLAGIKIELNNCASIPYINRGDSNNGFDNSIGFRDASHLCFQSQDIVANQSVLFYKTHQTKHQEKLKRWLPYILGAESRETMEKKDKLKELQTLLNDKQKEYDKEKKLTNDWIQRLIKTLSDAKLYGLYNGSINNLSQDDLIILVKQILDESKNGYSLENNNSSLDNEIRDIENELDKLSEEAAKITKRIKNIYKIQNTLIEYDDGSRRKINRLGISNWLLSNKKESNKCPLCGETTHPFAEMELEKICKAVRRYEDLCTKSVDIPAAIKRELENLQKDLNTKQNRINDLEKLLEQCNQKNEEIIKYTEKRAMFFKYIGQIEYTLEMINSLTETGDLSTTIENLKKEIEKINEYLNSNNSSKKLYFLLQKLDLKILETLKKLDVEEKYKETLPSFSIDELSIKVKDDKGDEHLLTEIGSASNWVSFHLALCCALQELLNNEHNKDSCVPSFVVFDQPSQVYFPRVGNKDDYELKDNDAEAVKKMFIALSESVKKSNGAWQAIIMEHADSGVYGNIEGVHEVEVWRNGRKLIPLEWLDSKENK